MAKIGKDTVPEGFTMGLALTDALPVLFFGGSMVLVAKLLTSPLFFTGALLCLYAGAAKVLWKIIAAAKKKNVWWLFLQMRYVMPAGMLLMAAGLVLNGGGKGGAFFAAALRFPATLFFALGISGMVLMTVFAFTLDSADPKANAKEQLTNGIAQACFFAGLLAMTL